MTVLKAMVVTIPFTASPVTTGFPGVLAPIQSMAALVMTGLQAGRVPIILQAVPAAIFCRAAPVTISSPVPVTEAWQATLMY
uniref:hypothetical protein n=1 Tax=Rhizobium sp. CFBP 8762 TaxID=2775279 RepID=UPI001FCFE521|nr:hypothetical protein [Rhizobium sp. CFBP 8762]